MAGTALSPMEVDTEEPQVGKGTTRQTVIQMVVGSKTASDGAAASAGARAEKDEDPTKGILFWNRTLEPTGLEGEGFFPDVVPKVDAVDFHDPGDEDDGGDYDVMEDPVSGEKFKVAKDEYVLWYEAGKGPHLDRALAREQRRLRGKGSRARRSSCASVLLDSSDDSEADDEDDNDHDGEGRDDAGVDHGSGSRRWNRGGQERKEGDQEKYWSDPPSGVFATSSDTGSGSESDSSSSADWGPGPRSAGWLFPSDAKLFGESPERGADALGNRSAVERDKAPSRTEREGGLTKGFPFPGGVANGHGPPRGDSFDRTPGKASKKVGCEDAGRSERTDNAKAELPGPAERGGEGGEGGGARSSPGVLEMLGVKPEFMPIVQKDWESQVILGYSSEEEENFRRRRSQNGASRSQESAGKRKGSDAKEATDAKGAVGAKDAREAKDARNAKETKEAKGAKGAKGVKDGDPGAARRTGPTGVGLLADEGADDEAGGSKGHEIRTSTIKSKKSAKARSLQAAKGAGEGAAKLGRITSFPAPEGLPWVDPPLVYNPRVDAGDWESEVLLDDSMKPKRPKIPPYPEAFLAVKTPRPMLKVLRTEAHQDLTNIAERTARRQMALEKQKRLQMAALTTGYTINTLGEGKASRAETHIRAVVVRPIPHASPAEDKILISGPKSWEELRNLHRPRIPSSSLIPGQKWMIRLPRKLKTQEQRDSSGLGARIGEVVAMPMRREKDLLPLESGSTFVMLEYIEERPPLLATTGMASKIITFARNSNRRLLNPGEPLNASAGGFGVRRELSPQEDSPFLGEIRPGCEQPSICNGLFRAPIFKHEPLDSDFLLIREPLSKREKEKMAHVQKQKDKNKASFFGGTESMPGTPSGGGQGGGGGAGSFAASAKAAAKLGQNFVIRPMPVVFLVGQTEPQIEALDPVKPSSKVTHATLPSKWSQELLNSPSKFRLFDTTKAGQIEGSGVHIHKVFNEVKHLSLPRAKEATKNRLRTLLREIAERRDSKDDPEDQNLEGLWAVKPEVDIHLVTAQAGRTFKPEDFCALEAMVAAWAHLSELGVDQLTSHEAVAKALVKMKKRQDNLAAQVKEVRSAAGALEKQRALVARTAKAKGKAEPGYDGGLGRRALCMGKLAEVLTNQLNELKRVRSVAQYLHRELQLVPWTLTTNFVKHHGLGPGQGTNLTLSGVGDPSGCGEGFSFLTRQVEQQAKSSSASLTPTEKTLADRSVQKVTGTSGDLRRLTMVQLASTCEAMGIPKDTVKTLKRWDRVHMIKELASVAVAENVKDHNIYARFVRKKRPNATVDKDMYRANCNDIWERQAAMLSMTHEEMKEYLRESEGKRRSKSSSSSKEKETEKEKKEKEKDKEDDGGGSATASGAGKEGDEGDESKDEEDEDRDGDDSDSDSDSDDGEGGDGANLDEDALNLSDMEETLEGLDGDGDVMAPAKSLHDLAASSNRDGEELDDERQLLMLQRELQGDRGDAARWGISERFRRKRFGRSGSRAHDGGATTVARRDGDSEALRSGRPGSSPLGAASMSIEEARKAQMEELTAKLGGKAELPTQAVRRITRTVWPDGSEMVTVSYSLKRQDLVRLDAKSGKRKSTPKKGLQAGAAASGGTGGSGGASGGASGGTGANTSPLGYFLPRPQQSAEVKAASRQDRNAGTSGGDDVVLKIRLPQTAMATKDKKRKRSGGESTAQMRPKEENLYALKRHNSRLTVESRDKLPRNRMRNLISRAFKKLVDRPDSAWFRVPVPRNVYPDYYAKIKEPIDLRSMQAKNIKFEYTTREAVMRDMRLLVQNAERYNGESAEISQNARDVLADCEVQLQDPEIEEVEAALLEEQQPNNRLSKKSKSGGGAQGGGGSNAGSKGAASRPNNKKGAGQAVARGATKTRGLSTITRPSMPAVGSTASAAPSRAGAAMASPPSAFSTSPTPIGGAALPKPKATMPPSSTSSKPSPPSLLGAGAPPRPAAVVAPGLPGARAPAPSIAPKKPASVFRPPAKPPTTAMDTGDAGTSSDSSDGEEVVEAGGQVTF